ncbi:vesicle budding-related protein, protein transporter SEC13 [Pseudohyphozyma bogoriensis]|nr:vesicle budding-related protein, protein transporter SEC13 [Pseudohyphozyma bogoriensis]
MAAASATQAKVETGHSDLIHDAQLDYYGRRLATASSDRTIRIFEVEGESDYRLADTLRGHDGPIHALAWAHPSFGSILASCSFDGKVFIWKENEGPGNGPKGWSRIKEHLLHNASVNAIAWAPHELGPILACASSDGKVSVLTFNNDGTWDASLFHAHPLGATSVTWAPAVAVGSLTAADGPDGGASGISQVKRFATGGCDGLVRVWGWKEDTKTWSPDPVQPVLEGHADWVRDVAWAPSVGVGRAYVASAGQDKTVYIWTQDSPRSQWSKVALEPSTTSPAGAGAPAGEGKFGDVVWRVSWSVSGNVLAVSSGDGKVSLWKENLQGKFEEVSTNTTDVIVSFSKSVAMSKSGWFGFGRGTVMIDADIIVVWANSDGSWTLSHREANSTTMPELTEDTKPANNQQDASGTVAIIPSLSSSSTTDDAVVTWGRPLKAPTSYITDQPDNADFTQSANTAFIYAYGDTNPGKDDYSATFTQHGMENMGQA